MRCEPPPPTLNTHTSTSLLPKTKHFPLTFSAPPPSGPADPEPPPPPPVVLRSHIHIPLIALCALPPSSRTKQALISSVNDKGFTPALLNVGGGWYVQRHTDVFIYWAVKKRAHL